jgi:hypothetical protein
MVTVKQINKQNLCDDLMVENLKQAQRIAALEAMVASLRINQHTQPAITNSESTPCLCNKCELYGSKCCLMY